MFVSLYSDLEIAYESPELITQTFSVNMRGINSPTKTLSEKSQRILRVLMQTNLIHLILIINMIYLHLGAIIQLLKRKT